MRAQGLLRAQVWDASAHAVLTLNTLSFEVHGCQVRVAEGRRWRLQRSRPELPLSSPPLLSSRLIVSGNKPFEGEGQVQHHQHSGALIHEPVLLRAWWVSEIHVASLGLAVHEPSRHSCALGVAACLGGWLAHERGAWDEFRALNTS